jgi:hypothetical protein
LQGPATDTYSDDNERKFRLTISKAEQKNLKYYCWPPLVVGGSYANDFSQATPISDDSLSMVTPPLGSGKPELRNNRLNLDTRASMGTD